MRIRKSVEICNHASDIPFSLNAMGKKKEPGFGARALVLTLINHEKEKSKLSFYFCSINFKIDINVAWEIVKL